MDTAYYLDRAVELFKEELGDQLIGIYLHGSLAMGCFNPNKSDIDLLIVVQEALTTETNKRIAKRVLKLHETMPNDRGIELSIVLENVLQHFVYPTPFEFHYSDFHRKSYQADDDYICGGYDDADLAAHFVVAYYRGIALYGKAFREAFQPIDELFYIKSILYDIQNAATDIIDTPMYITLNLCRVLFFLREGAVASKKEGGDWGMHALPSKYHPMIERSLNEYSGIEDQSAYNREMLTAFASYMLSEINKDSRIMQIHTN
ncbi:aminoglycoside adenylyltransferase domain-containing protein [Paenibacillus sp. KS-LC4]|uniref:aminoglycoside adenylyltransferase domain-containing protein n=1 Tax=Paenibacillus sp. KS-LC4 TaxID=2979727 RepID=UPI0030CF9032